MTPQEKKAREIYERFLPLVDCGENRYTTKNQSENAKQCALICVDEILKTGYLNGTILGITKKYWQEVKNHIEKL